jgi:hypothetical protein
MLEVIFAFAPSLPPSTTIYSLRSTQSIVVHAHIYTTVPRALNTFGYTISYNPYNSHTMPSSTPSKSLQAAETEAFERELAALTAYEDGWDRWDGPVWPVGYEQCRLRTSRPLFSFPPPRFPFSKVHIASFNFVLREPGTMLTAA